MRINVSAYVFLASCLIALAGSCFGFEPLKTESEVVRLSGTIGVENHFGPPGFGETPKIDKKNRVPMLKLDVPQVIVARSSHRQNEKLFQNVLKIQLIAPRSLHLWQQAGRHVVLEGTLLEGESGEHYTDVVMIVRKREK